MKLATFEPRLYCIGPDTESGGRTMVPTDDVAKAQGLMMLCPGCYAKNSGPVGTHSILLLFKDRGVPETEEPLPGRWIPSGLDLAHLTVRASVLIPDCWHGFITDGEVSTC